MSQVVLPGRCVLNEAVEADDADLMHDADDHQRSYCICGWYFINSWVPGVPVCWWVKLRAILVCGQLVSCGFKTILCVGEGLIAGGIDCWLILLRVLKTNPNRDGWLH